MQFLEEDTMLRDPAGMRSGIEKRIDVHGVELLLSRLLKYQSYQTNLFEKEPMVLNFIKDVVLGELRSAGMDDLTIDGTGNLIARIPSTRGGARLLLVSYAMTGSPGTMKDPFSGEILSGESLGVKGKVVWGRGACEQKSTLGAMLTALRLVSEMGVEPAGDLTLVVSTSGETGTHDSLRQVIEKDGVAADYAIISGEPKIQVANKGRVDVFVTIEGQPYHSRMPWKAADAIQGMFEAYSRLSKMIPHPTEKSHSVLGQPTLVPTAIESFPKDGHTIQSKCVLTFDRRLIPGEEPE